MKYIDFQRKSDHHKNVFTKLNCVKGLLIKTSSIQLCTAINLPKLKNRTKKQFSVQLEDFRVAFSF